MMMKLGPLLMITIIAMEALSLFGFNWLCFNNPFRSIKKLSVGNKLPFSSRKCKKNRGFYSTNEEESEDKEKLPQIPESTKRQFRKERQELLNQRFLSGNDLIDLREDILSKERKLSSLLRVKNVQREILELRNEIRDLQSRDAEFVYAFARKNLDDARKMSIPSTSEIEKWNQMALDARSCIPHFNLEGLWVGKYGPHGYEMINITYIGDSIVAYKITGDKNVPKGEITFKADLTPVPIYQHHPSSNFISSSVSIDGYDDISRNRNLAPIQLTETAAKQWGVRQLIRFPGQGQVAAENFANNQWVDGQFIMVGENYFSFAWVPIGYQIFFGRPSSSLTLKMMREEEDRQKEQTEGSDECDIDSMRECAYGSLDETMVSIDRKKQEDAPPINNIIYGEGCFE